MHNGFIVKVTNLKPHGNADKLQLATFFGETVIVGLDVNIDDIGIYFPCDLQLSKEYCDANDLCRKHADGTDGKGYLEREKRNIRAINLRGEKSYGLYMPLSSLSFTGVDITNFNVGDKIEIVNKIEICCKYVPRCNPKGGNEGGNRTRKHKIPVAPLFMEHADTEQLNYNLAAFKPGDEVEITLKMHGTSQRTAHLPVLKGYKRTLWDKITRKEGKPIYDWGYVTGTRRTVLEDYEGGYYGSNEFREPHAKVFEGKLWKGETVYYEVVSFTDNGTPIMGRARVPKEAQKEYGEEMIFHYGLSEGSDMYVYRITLTNEDGQVVEYTPDFMRYRCEQMGIKCVPTFWSGIIPENPASADDPTISAGEWVKNKAELYYDGPDPIGKTHVREGVVVRIINRPKFSAFKHKNFLFKQISGIITEEISNSTEVISEDILTEM